MSNVEIQSQSLVTEETAQLYEILINGYYVYLASGLEYQSGFQNIDYTWNGSTKNFQYIEIAMSGVRSDLTGALSEPSLQIACDSLWKNDTWDTATFGFTSLAQYQGARVTRQRIFYDMAVRTTFFPQTYYIKEVSEFDAYSITFTLTPMLGGDTLDLPSARKLDLKDC
jgi:hypothetical protein